jgi:tetratricopeptide (TPR) repeat protein
VTGLRSQKREREHLVRMLRAQDRTWVEIADVFRARYRVNARIALRWARGWSQSRAADEWNNRWPDDLKTNKNFSYWELWPSSTGHAPPLDVLTRLAELYQCRLSDLLTDQADYRHRDSAHHAPPVATDPPTTLTGEIVAASQAEILFLDLLSQHPPDGGVVPSPSPSPARATTLTRQLQEANYEELAQVIVMWAERVNPSIGRRELLSKLSAAFTLAATAPLFDGLDPDEREHVTRALQKPSGFDEATLRYCEGTVANLRRQGDVLGARLTLQSALGHRQLARNLVTAAPPTFKTRALSAYAELTQFVGWLCFNAGDYRGAQHYYDDARTVAHDAQNVELVTYVLCTMSHLATWQSKPRVGIDHAVAAQVWAAQTGSPRASAYAADRAARAFAADRQADDCRRVLDAEGVALADCRPDTSEPSWWYFYDESFYWSTQSECALFLGNADAALAAADRAVTLIDPANIHNLAFRTLFRAEAHVQKRDVAEAARAIGEAAILASVNTSQRISQRITTLRAALAPAQRTKPVRELDDILAVYRRPPSGSGSTYLM